MTDFETRLKAFQTENNIFSKGKLSVVIQFTRLVRGKEFPLNPDDFKTVKEGQVAGLGGGNLKKILKDHGIAQQLSAEGGRTSRGSMGLMIEYVDFLNEWHAEEAVDLAAIEAFWAEQVREYFRNQPLILTADTSKTIGSNLDDLFEQAKKRQKQNPGTQYLGTVLQHLVAAKLCLIMPEGSFEIHGASVADAPTARSGDFVINKTIIHCTTSVGDLLINKCQANISNGYRPVIITIFERVQTALNQIEDAGLAGRVEVWDVQQFLRMCMSIASLMKISETQNLGLLLKTTTRLSWKKKVTPVFALSLRQGEIVWRMFLILKKDLMLCDKLSQRKISLQKSD